MTAKRNGQFEVYRSTRLDANGDVVEGWYWRLVAPNNKVIADGSESYATQYKALDAVARLQNYATAAVIKVIR